MSLMEDWGHFFNAVDVKAGIVVVSPAALVN